MEIVKCIAVLIVAIATAFEPPAPTPAPSTPVAKSRIVESTWESIPEAWRRRFIENAPDMVRIGDETIWSIRIQNERDELKNRPRLPANLDAYESDEAPYYVRIEDGKRCTTLGEAFGESKGYERIKGVIVGLDGPNVIIECESSGDALVVTNLPAERIERISRRAKNNSKLVGIFSGKTGGAVEVHYGGDDRELPSLDATEPEPTTVRPEELFEYCRTNEITTLPQLRPRKATRSVGVYHGGSSGSSNPAVLERMSRTEEYYEWDDRPIRLPRIR